MEEISNNIQDHLLDIQYTYGAADPNSYINSPRLTLIYTSKRPNELYTAIANSIGLRNYLNQINATVTQHLFTDRSVILECTMHGL